MKQVQEQTFKILSSICKEQPIRITESCKLYQFYFANNCSFSYTKDDCLKLLKESK
jgi:hypothetical protein